MRIVNIKMKTIKTLYGGDATNKKTLETGDCLTIYLLEEAVSILLKKKKFMDYFQNEDSPQNFELKIPTSQLRYLQMKDCSFMFYRFFSCVPIHQYITNDKIQETIVKSGTKQVIIYNSKE